MRLTLETYHYGEEARKVIYDPSDEPQLKVAKYTRPGGPAEGLMVFARQEDGSWRPCGWVRAKDKDAVLGMGPVDSLKCQLLERYVKRDYCVLKVDIY